MTPLFAISNVPISLLDLDAGCPGNCFIFFRSCKKKPVEYIKVGRGRFIAHTSHSLFAILFFALWSELLTPYFKSIRRISIHLISILVSSPSRSEEFQGRIYVEVLQQTLCTSLFLHWWLVLVLSTSFTLA